VLICIHGNLIISGNNTKYLQKRSKPNSMLSSVLRFLGKTRSFLDIDLHRSPPISENGYVPVAIDLN